MTIINKEVVESLYGYWPEFADGRINKFIIENTADGKCNILFTIFYIDSDQNISSTTNLLFNAVTDVDLNDLKEQNIIDQLSYKESNDHYTVSLEASFGLSGNFNCQSIEVLNENA